jgi:MFS family permease
LRRRLLYAALYFSEGAPIGFLWWALPTKLRGAGVAVEDIAALTSILALPWALKFVWAPLVDTLRSSRWGLRAWITASQLAMGAALLPLLWLDFERQFSAVYLLLIAHAFAAATQDVAVDALCIGSIPERERGSTNGWMQAGMLAGRSLFGGGFLLLESRIGFGPVLIGLIACVWATLIALLMSRVEEPGPSPARAVARALWTAVRTGRAWLGLAFAAVGGAAYEGAAAVAGPFLRDHGVSQDGVGVFFAAPAVIGMAGGALAGGWLADRSGAPRVVTASLIAVASIVAALSGLDNAGVGANASLAAFSILYVAIGVFTASSYALFMELADGPARATMFSAFMGMTNLCELWASRAVGELHPHGGYALGFAAVAAASFASVLLVRRFTAYE